MALKTHVLADGSISLRIVNGNSIKAEERLASIAEFRKLVDNIVDAHQAWADEQAAKKSAAEKASVDAALGAETSEEEFERLRASGGSPSTATGAEDAAARAKEIADANQAYLDLNPGGAPGVIVPPAPESTNTPEGAQPGPANATSSDAGAPPAAGNGIPPAAPAPEAHMLPPAGAKGEKKFPHDKAAPVKGKK